MEAKIYISGKIGEDVTLLDVIRQYKSFEGVTSVLVVVDSIGGSVAVGDSIYDYLEGLKADHAVNTHIKKAYSIAAKIASVGDVRTVEAGDDRVMIHFPWIKPEAGGAEYFEELAAELRGIEDEFAAYYSEMLGIDEETVRNLLDNETMLTGEEAVEIGFATAIKEPTKAVALYDNKTNVKSKNSKMSKDKEKAEKKSIKGLLAVMAAYLKDDEPKAELELQDSNGVEIIFPDLEEDSIPSIGDAATVDGSPIEDGSYIMPQLDEATVTFVDGVITEIVEKATEEEEETTEEAEAQAEEEKPEVKAEEVQQISVWTMEVLNDTFTVGDTVKYMDWDDNEQTIGSGEFQLSDGRRVVTDATGVIVVIKEPTNDEGAKVETEEEAEAAFQAMLEKVSAKVEKKFKAKAEKQEAEIVALKAQLKSDEVVPSFRDRKILGKSKKANRAAEILAASKD